jgi:replicative DNA helicase
MTAEKSVLGAAMLEQMAVKQIVDRLSAADFQNEANRSIFAAMKKLHGDGKPVDIITLTDELGSN